MALLDLDLGLASRAAYRLWAQAGVRAPGRSGRRGLPDRSGLFTLFEILGIGLFPLLAWGKHFARPAPALGPSDHS